MLKRNHINKSVLLEILLQDKCRTLDNNGKSCPPSALVYTTVSNMMRERGSNITAKHIYVIIRENCNGQRSNAASFWHRVR